MENKIAIEILIEMIDCTEYMLTDQKYIDALIYAVKQLEKIEHKSLRGHGKTGIQNTLSPKQRTTVTAEE